MPYSDWGTDYWFFPFSEAPTSCAAAEFRGDEGVAFADHLPSGLSSRSSSVHLKPRLAVEGLERLSSTIFFDLFKMMTWLVFLV